MGKAAKDPAVLVNISFSSGVEIPAQAEAAKMSARQAKNLVFISCTFHEVAFIRPDVYNVDYFAKSVKRNLTAE